MNGHLLWIIRFCCHKAPLTKEQILERAGRHGYPDWQIIEAWKLLIRYGALRGVRQKGGGPRKWKSFSDKEEKYFFYKRRV